MITHKARPLKVVLYEGKGAIPLDSGARANVLMALLDKGWPVYLDETALLFDRIWVSAGRVGTGLIVGVEDLVRVLGAQLADLSG